MAHARMIVHYADDTALTLEVGHDGACHPDLLDELVSRCARLYAETVGEDVPEDEQR